MHVHSIPADHLRSRLCRCVWTQKPRQATSHDCIHHSNHEQGTGPRRTRGRVSPPTVGRSGSRLQSSSPHSWAMIHRRLGEPRGVDSSRPDQSYALPHCPRRSLRLPSRGPPLRRSDRARPRSARGPLAGEGRLIVRVQPRGDRVGRPINGRPALGQAGLVAGHGVHDERSARMSSRTPMGRSRSVIPITQDSSPLIEPPAESTAQAYPGSQRPSGPPPGGSIQREASARAAQFL